MYNYNYVNMPINSIINEFMYEHLKTVAIISEFNFLTTSVEITRNRTKFKLVGPEYRV